jgi:hypothetical protein
LSVEERAVYVFFAGRAFQSRHRCLLGLTVKAITFAMPADMELRPAPITPHWVIEGNPVARSRRLSTSPDTTSSTMVWTCTPGKFHWHYTVDETLYILEGEVFVTDHKDEVRRLGPGDLAFFPAGSQSVWHVTKDIRKIAFCRQSMPLFAGFGLRAINKLINILAGNRGGALESDESEETVKQATQVRAA